MANASQSTNTGAHNGHWTATATKSGTYEFNTAGKFVDRDIDLIIPEAEISAGSTDATATVSSVTVSETKDASGKYPVTGNGTVSGTITATVDTKGFTDEESYTGGTVTGTATVNAGLSPAVLAASVDTISGANITSVTVGTKSGTSYPVTGSTTVTGKLHANVSTAGYATSAENKEGNLSQSVSLSGVTLPAAAASVASSGTISTPTISKGTGTASSGAITTTQPTSGPYITVTSKAAATDVTNTVTVGTKGYLGDKSEITATGSLGESATRTSYVPITEATVTPGTTTVGTSKGSDGNYSVTRGTFDISEGYISGTVGDLAAASFANSATSGTSYVDISETAASPILVSGKGLYINKGYVDNLYISLAKLTPDEASGASAIKAGMLNSVSAYDSDGNLITGDIATKTQDDLIVMGVKVTAPAGYYATSVTKAVATGSVNSYAINETAQADVVVTAGTKSGNYYPVSIPSLTGTVNRTAGYISGTTSTAADTDGGVVGKIAAATVSGTASDTKSTTLTYNSYKNTSNLTSGTYRTSAATGYTYHIDSDASVTAATASASRTVSAGYSDSDNTASATATIAADSKSGSIYLLDGAITNNTSGGTSIGTINSGAQIKIGKGYYPNDLYYTAQSEATKSPITGTLDTSITSGYTAPTLVNTTTAGVPYVTIAGNGSMTTGHIYNGTANAKTQYMEVYAGTYSIS